MSEISLEEAIREVVAANAHKMFAANELYEALEGLRSQFVQAFEAHNIELSDTQKAADMAAIKALAKARGEQS